MGSTAIVPTITPPITRSAIAPTIGPTITRSITRSAIAHAITPIITPATTPTITRSAIASSSTLAPPITLAPTTLIPAIDDDFDPMQYIDLNGGASDDGSDTGLQVGKGDSLDGIKDSHVAPVDDEEVDELESNGGVDKRADDGSPVDKDGDIMMYGEWNECCSCIIH